MIRIVEIGDTTFQGKTEPVLCRGEDGFDYVVKGQFAGSRALIAEWIANRLGRLIDLPIPEFELMYLDSNLLKYGIKQREAQNLGKGTLFGSRRIANLVEIRASDLGLINVDLRAKVLAFDWWICNADRILIDGGGNPNLLWSEDKKELVVIDHNLAFEPTLMGDFWMEHALRDSIKQWNSTFREGMELAFKGALEHLQSIWSELPSEWIESPNAQAIKEVEALLWRFDREPSMFWRAG
jgi:hypothetical protein